MISAFGIIAIIVFAVSVFALVLHRKVITRRVTVDEALAALDILLRERLDIIYENAVTQEIPEIRALCEGFFALDTRGLLVALNTIKMENAEVLAEIMAETDEALAGYNKAVAEFNAYAAKFPMRVMAFVLGLGTEKPI